MKIAVLDWNTMTMNGDLSPDCFRRFGETSVFDMTEPCNIAENIGDSDIALCNKVIIGREVIDQCPNLRYIGLFATGFNNIDIEYAAEKGITVCNAGQYSTNAVAQHVFAFILSHFSRIGEYDCAVKNGEWERSPIFSYFPIPTRELYGMTIAVIGYGSIGKAVAKIADAFGMNVIVSTRTSPDNCPYPVAGIGAAVENADIITLHCPLTDKTRNMICCELINKMKPSAVLINTSRGGTVNEEDLACALNSGRIAAAYLDVLGSEPMNPDTPLKTAKNCIITPHIAWAALETRQRLLGIVCDNLDAWMNGSPKNKVN